MSRLYFHPFEVVGRGKLDTCDFNFVNLLLCFVTLIL